MIWLSTSLASSSSLLLVLLVAATASIDMASALRFERQHMSVNILNETPYEWGALFVHCSSHDDDLGVKIVQGGHWYGFGFEANVLGTTLFTCTFTSGGGNTGLHTKSFIVFQDIGFWGFQKLLCRKCVWLVKDDGFYRSENLTDQRSVKIYTWK